MAKSMNEQRLQTRKRIRGRVSGTADKPRLTVYKSLQRIYVQAIDDAQGVTLATASTLEKDLRAKVVPILKLPKSLANKLPLV